jgi:hypothetical protein
MVIDNLNFVSVARTPTKADPPLSVDADAVLPAAVPLQLFQSVRRGYADSRFCCAINLSTASEAREPDASRAAAIPC